MNGNKSSQPNGIHPLILKVSTMKKLKHVLYQGNVTMVSVKSSVTNLLVFSEGINENKLHGQLHCEEWSGTFQPGTKRKGEHDVIEISKITNVLVSKEQQFTLSSSKVTTK